MFKPKFSMPLPATHSVFSVQECIFVTFTGNVKGCLGFLSLSSLLSNSWWLYKIISPLFLNLHICIIPTVLDCFSVDRWIMPDTGNLKTKGVIISHRSRVQATNRWKSKQQQMMDHTFHPTSGMFVLSSLYWFCTVWDPRQKTVPAEVNGPFCLNVPNQNNWAFPVACLQSGLDHIYLML